MPLEIAIVSAHWTRYFTAEPLQKSLTCILLNAATARCRFVSFVIGPSSQTSLGDPLVTQRDLRCIARPHVCKEGR